MVVSVSPLRTVVRVRNPAPEGDPPSTRPDDRSTTVPDRSTTVPDPMALLEALPDIVMAIDGDARLVWVNAAAVEQGWDRDGWLGRSALDLIHPDDLPMALASIGRDMLGTALGLLVLVCRDIGERRKWEVAAGDVPRFQAVVQHSSAVSMLVDAGGRIHSVSAALTRLTGLDQERLRGEAFWSIAAPGHEVVLAEAGKPDGQVATGIPQRGEAWPDTRLAQEIGMFRIHQGASRQGATPQQHAKAHGIAVGESDVDGPGFAADLEPGSDHVAGLAVTAGIGHRWVVHHRRLTGDTIAGPAARMDGKADPVRALANER